MDDMGVIAKMTGVAVHDGWKPYRSYDVVHALCNAHHLRELDGVVERFDQEWAEQMITLLARRQGGRGAGDRAGRRCSSLRRCCTPSGCATASSSPRDGAPTRRRRAARPGKWYQNSAVNLLGRLDTYRDDVLRFTVDFNVPFDNNQGERDIRMVKLQQKISGSWRTKTGADHFCAIRSYVSTMKKHGYSVLEGLQRVFIEDPWLPAMVPRT